MRYMLLTAIPMAIAAYQPVAAQSPYLSAPSSSQARSYQDNFPNWYLGVNAQLSFVQDSDVSSPATGLSELDFDTGYALGGAIGFRPYATSGLFADTRFELEYTYRNADVSSATVSGAGISPDAGILTHSIMLNAFYDIDTGTQWTPYFGGGIGFAFSNVTSSTLNIDDNDENFAYQGMLGVTYAPQSLPDTEWGIGYRYFGSESPSVTDSAGNNIEYDVDSHNLELIGRFRF